MDARRARHLRQALNGGLHFLARNQHQIRHFINDNNDIRQRRGIQHLLLVFRLASFWVKTDLNGTHRLLAFFAQLF